MKNIFLITIILATVGLTSCEKFLDIKPVAEKPEETVLNSPDNVNAILMGAYNRLQSGDMYGGQLYKVGELMGDNLDFNYINSGTDANFKTRDFSIFSNPGAGMWNAAYTAIYRSNLVIKAVDENAFEAAGGTKNMYKGEALFIRAISHFELVRMFALPYSNSNGADPGIPVRTIAYTPNTAQDRVPRSSVSEVYTQVISDLKAAIPLLPSSNFGRATSWAAKALLARVYFSMNDFANAASYAGDVIDNSGITLGSPSDTNSALYPFYNKGTGVVFQIVNQAGFTQSTGLRYAFWNYNPSSINFSLDYDTSDVNSTHIYDVLKQYGGRRYDSLIVKLGDTLVITNNSKSDSVQVTRPYSTKFRGPNSANVSTDVPVNIPVIRLAEMYLTRAESYAELGQFAKARADYNKIREIAGLPDDTQTPDAGLRDRIRLERRVELVLENDRYHELRRQKSTDIRGFSYNSTKVLLIPLDEINGNSGIQQNY